jgi:DMSO/TMAO reductase YedYZ molybdopterin-dependent catalytic subunit
MANTPGLLSVLSMIAFSVGAPLSGQTPALAKLAVTGDVMMPLTLSADELGKMPRETVPLTGRGATVQYEGVPLLEILARAGAPVGKTLRGKALASYVVAKASDGYQVVFTLAELDPQFAAERILVADKRDGKPLPTAEGPLRIVCPGDKEGARSVRMLEALDVVQLRK